MSKHISDSGNNKNEDMLGTSPAKVEKPPQFSDLICKRYEVKETNLKKSVISQARKLSISSMRIRQDLSPKTEE